MNSNVTQGSKGTHGQFATPTPHKASSCFQLPPPSHSTPFSPSQVDCETSPGRAKANTAAACFFGLCHSPLLSTTPARIEQMPKNVTVPRTITTVNCGRGWRGQHRRYSSGQFFLGEFLFSLRRTVWPSKQCVRVCVSLRECVWVSVYFYCIYH